MSSLSPEQQHAFELFLNKKNIFVTGPAGTGKTHFIQQIVKHTPSQRCIQVCAMTGTAARLLNCKATTLHSWSGIKLGRGNKEDIVKYVAKNSRAIRNWKMVDILVLDEISMLSHKIINVLDLIAKRIRRCQKPFGGIQLVFTGDFYQLAPIETYGEPETGQFCFEWNQWYTTFPLKQHIVMQTIFRQKDPVFQRILNEVRGGEISNESCEILAKHVDKDTFELTRMGIVPTQILPIKSTVDAINQMMYAKIREPEMTFMFKIIKNMLSYCDSGESIPIDILDTCKHLTEDEIDYEVQQLINNTPCENTLNLKIGTFVMLTVNLDVPSGLTNGTQGIIEGFADNRTPLMKLCDGRVIPIDRHVWQSEEYPMIGISNYPLIYCWGITTHRGQGCTLDYASVDLGKSVFAYGQSYVGLSRVKTLDGLYLTAFVPQKIKAHPKVKEFYSQFQPIT